MDRIYEEFAAPRVKHTKPGDNLVVRYRAHDGEECTRKYKVIRVFPFMVLAVSKRGHKKYFSYGDLVMLGKEG